MALSPISGILESTELEDLSGQDLVDVADELLLVWGMTISAQVIFPDVDEQYQYVFNTSFFK